MKNAAEEKSPGTGISPGSSAAAGSTVTRRAGSSPWTVTGVPASELLSSAPAARSMRSVWSRVGRRSITLVGSPGEQAGEQQARLHLRAGHRRAVLDPAQLCAADGERRQAVVGRADVGAHQPQRFDDPVDRPLGNRLVAREGPFAVRLTGQPTGKDAHQGAGVTHVDEGMGLGAAQADAADPEVERRG